MASAPGNAPEETPPDATGERAERSYGYRLWHERRGWIIGLVALLGLAVAAWLLFGSGSGAAQADSGGGGNASSGRDTLRAEGYLVQPVRLTDHLFTTGTLRANEGVELTAEASGKIARIAFREGERVRAGALLVALDTEDLEAERRRLQAELKVARRRAEREKALLEKGGVSRQSYEETVGQVNVLRAQIDRVEAQIAKHRIRAPFSGTVGLRYVSPGSYVSPGQRVASLRDLSPIKVDFSVPARYGRRLEEGDPVRFNVQGTERTYRAEVYAIEPSVSEETRAVQVRARTPNRDRSLRPGAYAEVEVIFEKIEDALVVPSIAVLPESGRKRVFVAQNGAAQPRTVQTGIRTDSTVQITSGIRAQDTVLVSGLQSMRAGAPVVVDTLVDGAPSSGVGGLKRPVEASNALPTGGG